MEIELKENEVWDEVESYWVQYLDNQDIKDKCKLWHFIEREWD
jgi:hypothetical protein